MLLTKLFGKKETVEEKLSRELRSRFNYTENPRFVKLSHAPRRKTAFSADSLRNVDYIIEGGVIVRPGMGYVKPFYDGVTRYYVQFYNSTTDEIFTYEATPAKIEGDFTSFKIRTEKEEYTIKEVGVSYKLMK